uniref:Cystatin Pr17a n=1 Tax=Platymeris rhadamanthus TaxID=1134088 RepID=CYS17_PLARH|nr:RecName: Full=Cystatin Pr17a; AltName: Full=Venom cystatin domain peptide Pr17a; Flags: Precursor [Platymeris rhadamanthus]QHB21503.1 venom cystatin domain peptide Pr17a [Platymeris rhadamanthus]
MSCLKIITLFLFLAAVIASSIANQKGKHRVGAPEQINPNDANLKISLAKAISSQNAGVVVVKITKATRQVVAGFKYVVEFVAKVAGTNKQKVCRTVYIEQAWLKKTSVKNFSCK